MGLANGLGDPAVDVIGIRLGCAIDEMDEELPVSLRAGQPGVYDSDCHATPRPRGLKQAVGEAARGRADIRAIASVDGHTKGIESMLQLLSTSRHEARWTLDVQFGGVVQLLSGLVVAVHQAGEAER